MDDSASHDRGRTPRNPTPTLTALLMDSNYPQNDDVELSLMELDDDHINNNSFQLECPHRIPRPAERATHHTSYHSKSDHHEIISQRKPHGKHSDSMLEQHQQRCACACSESVALVQEGNGRTDNLLAEWLTRSARMVRKYPVLGSIDNEDMRTLLYSSWKELVILYMAQNDFNFEVIPVKNRNIVCPHLDKPKKRKTIARMESCLPSCRHVEQLKFIIGKLKQMNIDSKEFALLRLLMLLNTGGFEQSVVA